MTLRLLFLGDRIIGGVSAYSKVMYETCTRLAKENYKVAHIPMGMANKMGIQNFQNILVYPSGNHPFAEDIAIEHYLNFKADMLITIKEPWVFNDIYRWAINFVPFCPIDHSPVSPMMTSRLHTAFKVIAISRFGQHELKEAGVESVYIPHGVDCDIYRPLPEHKSECKKMFGLPPDDFTVGVVAMNRVRKMIPRMLRGYARFRELNPDVKTHMMLWTDIRPTVEFEESPFGVADVSVDLLPEIMQLGLGESVIWPDRKLVTQGLLEWTSEDYKTGWDMVKLYNSFDVLFLCSGGEGFGMPLLEAQACGVVPITTDYAAGSEVVGVGLTVEPVDYVIINTPGTRFALASIDGMAEALTKIYNADREKLAPKARAFAERYDWKKIISDYWTPFLRQCETELYPLVKKEGVSSWA